MAEAPRIKRARAALEQRPERRRHPHQQDRRRARPIQACDEGYLSTLRREAPGLYLAKFDFRHNNRIRPGVNGQERATKTPAGICGKWSRYKPSYRIAQ